MSTIRLTVNKETEDVLSYLETQYKPLSRAEILKLGLSNLYHNTMNMDVEILDNETSKSVEEGIREIKEGKGIKFESVDKLMEYLNRDIDNVSNKHHSKVRSKISETNQKK